MHQEPSQPSPKPNRRQTYYTDDIKEHVSEIKSSTFKSQLSELLTDSKG